MVSTDRILLLHASKERKQHPAGRLGYQWVGCVNCSPAIHVPPAPKGLCDPATAATGMYERPAALDGEYGEPVGQCKEVGSGGVFERDWTKATVRFDCASWKGTVTPKHD